MTGIVEWFSEKSRGENEGTTDLPQLWVQEHEEKENSNLLRELKGKQETWKEQDSRKGSVKQ